MCNIGSGCESAASPFEQESSYGDVAPLERLAKGLLGSKAQRVTEVAAVHHRTIDVYQVSPVFSGRLDRVR